MKNETMRYGFLCYLNKAKKKALDNIDHHISYYWRNGREKKYYYLNLIKYGFKI